MNHRLVIYPLVATLICLGWFALHFSNRLVDNQIASTSLGPTARAKYIIDQKHHTLTVVTPGKTTKTYLNPNGPVSFTEKKNGTVTVTQRTWGTMLSPVLVAGIGSEFRFRMGGALDLFYIRRFECGIGLYDDPANAKDMRIFASAAYNFYGDILAMLSVDNHKSVSALIGLKFN